MMSSFTSRQRTLLILLAIKACTPNEIPINKSHRRTKVAPLNTFVAVKDEFDAKRDEIEKFVFQTLKAFSMNDDNVLPNHSSPTTTPSRIYTYNDFFTSLRSLSTFGIYGASYHTSTNPYSSAANVINTPTDEYKDHPSNRAFYLSQSDESVNAMLYAIVNVCAFLANVMVESIQYDSCEEWNGMGTDGFPSRGNDLVLSELNGVNGRYFPVSNSCGQFGMLYSEKGVCFTSGDGFSIDTNSTSENVDMSCEIDPELEIEAAPHPKYNYPTQGREQGYKLYGPPPFYCGPKSKEVNEYTGYWDGYSQEFVRDVAYPSALGKLDVEGCCYWGRGALSTKNVCNFGKLNYYMGSRAYREGRPSRYPNIDFCKNPWIICDTNRVLENGLAYPELKWTVALFEWIDRIQSNDNTSTNWNYMTQLKLFVDRGAKDHSFIEHVSSLVARGCDNVYCSTQPIPFMEQRRRNFEKLIYDIFDIQSKVTTIPSSSASNPLEKGTKYDYEYAEKWIQSKRSKIEGNIFISKNEALEGRPYFSTAYKFNSFISALRDSSLYGLTENKVFFLGDTNEGLRGFNAGLVNLALFLANVMVESITDDSCDELSLKNAAGKYTMSNSCGQNGRDYAEEVCPVWQSFMACDVNQNMEMEGQIPITDTLPFLSGFPPAPLKCFPGNQTEPSSVKGCCWWGRGALSTKGTCNIGKLNFHLGMRAKLDNRPSIYPDINFCKSPDQICKHKDTMEIRWVVAMFEWIDRIQSYYHEDAEWQYIDSLYSFVDGGMQDTTFLDAVNSIVAKGCHLSTCNTASSINIDSYRFGFERKENIINIMRLVFNLPVSAASSSGLTDNHTPQPTEPAIPNLFADMEAFERLFPSASPTISPTEAVVTVYPTTSPLEYRNTNPTESPVEFSNITVFNDGGLYFIEENVLSFDDESLIITDKTKLTLIGGNVTAPINSQWPAIRLSIGSIINATAGIVKGSDVGENFDEGGEAIQLNNGQSSTETAGYGEFYDGVKVVGGNGRVGGDALVVNGFGTEAVIYGGEFVGGSGERDDLGGYSIRVINSATVRIHGGSFTGAMKVEAGGLVLLYGCFKQNGDEVSGLFADDLVVNITVDGDVDFLPAEAQECDTLPSVAPTQFPTISPPPTPPVRNGIVHLVLSNVLIMLNLATFVHLCKFW